MEITGFGAYPTYNKKHSIQNIQSLHHSNHVVFYIPSQNHLKALSKGFSLSCMTFCVTPVSFLC